MLIPVIFEDGDCKLVDGDLLNELIAQGKAKLFLRLEGWTDADKKAIRKTEPAEDHADYEGRDRRQEFTLYDDDLRGASLFCSEIGKIKKNKKKGKK